MAEELPQVVLAASDSLIHRLVGSDEEFEMESDVWTQSAQVPGVRIINTWQVYMGVWLVLVKTEDGKFQILRSEDMRRFSLFCNYPSEIYNLFWIDDGIMVFCASDDWWFTTDTGLTWIHLVHGTVCPRARSMALIPIQQGTWTLVAYGDDRKIYAYSFAIVAGTNLDGEVPEYTSWDQVPAVTPAPDPNAKVLEYDSWADTSPWTDAYQAPGEWTELYDTSEIYLGRWFPAIAGGPIGVLAGAGPYLLRYDPGADSWATIFSVPSGIIKAITISDQSRKPSFMIVVEPTSEGQIDKLYWTHDMGDSLEEVLNRVGTLSSVQSVIPTGTNEPKTMFAVLGRRQVGGKSHYKLVQLD